MIFLTKPSSSVFRHILSASHPLSSLSIRSISTFTHFAGFDTTPRSTGFKPNLIPPTRSAKSTLFPSSSVVSHHFFSTQKHKSEDDAAETSLRSQKWWPLLKKTYGISNFQILTSIAVSSTVINYAPYHGGLGLLCFASLYGLHKYGYKHQRNLLSLGALSLLQTLTFGTAFSIVDGMVMNEAFAISTAAVASLTGYTFWAARKGKKFNVFGTFLCSSLAPLPGLLQISYPFNPVLNGGGTLLLSGCTFVIFWHMSKGIQEIMADYVHNKLVRTWIMVELNLILLYQAMKISTFLMFV
ncbi:BI1-like protein [Euphorbia lathyris]|uniref:BI1-like protein n=1 Tax=Euphorbia lathyris TaxID=212925 RepID=UPI003313FB53